MAKGNVYASIALIVVDFAFVMTPALAPLFWILLVIGVVGLFFGVFDLYAIRFEEKEIPENPSIGDDLDDS